MNNSQVRPNESAQRQHDNQSFDSEALTTPARDRLNQDNGKSYRGTQLELQLDNLGAAPKYPLIDVPTGGSIRPEPTSVRKLRLIKLVGSIFLGLGLLAGLGYLLLRGANPPAKPDRSSVKGLSLVTVANVTQKTVPLQLQAIGSVLPASTVAITPQASGRITGVYFKKGQELKKGQLLFTLDDRTQIAATGQAQSTLAKDRAAIEQARANLAKDRGAIEQAKATLAKDVGLVRQAEATLAKDVAQLQFARAQSQRYGNLYRQGAVSQDQAQQYLTNGKVSEATLQADREAIANARAVVRGDTVAIENAQAVVKGDLAAIESAQAVANSDLAALNNVRVQQSYTKIYAPIDGRAGNILVMPGNVVQANSNTTPLVSIAKTHPIQVGFSIPETQLADVKKYMQNGKLKVNVAFAGDRTTQIPGVLSFVNNTVDNTTGTIQLIGDFANTNGQLFPGQYVNTTLTLTQQPNATVVPSQAVQNGPKGQFVFAVKSDDTVANVPVTVTNTIDGLSVISNGVKPGDRVVTDGQANLVDGGKIRLKSAANPALDGANGKADRGGQ